MSFQLYKEGQGTWARGVLAGVVGICGLLAAFWVFETLSTAQWVQGSFQLTVPFFNWSLDWAVVGAGLALVPFGVGGLWLYNKRGVADLLIETENELKTKVTWPTRKEVVYNSTVVVITCVVLGLWIFGADELFRRLSKLIYGI